MKRLLARLRARFRPEKPDEFDDTELFELQRRSRHIAEELRAGRMTLDEVREWARQQADRD